MGPVTVAPPRVPRQGDAPARRLAVHTLGCKVNAYESEVLAAALARRGWVRADDDGPVALCIVNTCTVTAESDRQARQLVRRLARRHPGARIVVTGCYAERDPQACARLPGVDLVVGNARKLDLPDLLDRLAGPAVLRPPLDGQVSLPRELVDGLAGHTRAFVQVQQGCDQGCTFCVIHRARGPHRSLDPRHVERQVARLLDGGCREIVLCGVDLGSYGRGAGEDGPGLAGLLRRLFALPGDYRLRISSLDPAHVDPPLLELFAAEPRLCPHLHLSIQSGNTLILKRMKRRYGAEQVYRVAEALRAARPGLTLGADLMAGFPTEDEDAFEDTRRMVEALEIAFPHVFTYSNRPGTPAARIPRQVPPAERRRRARRLRAAGAAALARHLAARRGDRERVLVEGAGAAPPGHLRARAGDYTTVFVPAGAAGAGDWLEVALVAPWQGGLIARPRP